MFNKTNIKSILEEAENIGATKHCTQRMLDGKGKLNKQERIEIKVNKSSISTKDFNVLSGIEERFDVEIEIIPCLEHTRPATINTIMIYITET